MDQLTFASKVVEALAWPLAAMVLVLALRREIRGLLPKVTKLKAGPLEAEFERELDKLAASSDTELESQLDTSRATPQRQMLLQLIQIHPRSAILEAWRDVTTAKTRAKRNRAESFGGSPPSATNEDIRNIETESLLTSEEFVLYKELKSLRNRAAHTPDFSPTPEVALKYVELAERIRQALERDGFNPVWRSD